MNEMDQDGGVWMEVRKAKQSKADVCNPIMEIDF